jgi:HK97 family phage portal protein
MPGLLTRIRQRVAPEARAAGMALPFGPALGNVAPVNARIAENLSMVLACVNAVGSGLASLPALVYRQIENGRIEAPQHPVSRLIRQPNPRQTWPDFLEWLLGSTLLYGNGLAAIESDGAGRPTALVPIPWQYVQVQLLPSGRLAFDVARYTLPWGGTGMPRRYLDSEVLHLKDRSDDGWLGRSRLSRAPEVLGAAMGLQTYSAAIWRNAATPSGAVEVPGNISPDAFRRLREWFEQTYSGAHNGRRVLFMDAGAKWTPLSVSPEDAEVLASRRFSGEEIARLFGVPPPIVGDLSHGTFTNSETAGRWFASFTLAPWARKIEAEFSRSVFNDPNYALEIDLSGLMRGDYAARWQANVLAVQAGILTADEVREAEGYNPLRPAPADADPVVPAGA